MIYLYAVSTGSYARQTPRYLRLSDAARFRKRGERTVGGSPSKYFSSSALVLISEKFDSAGSVRPIPFDLLWTPLWILCFTAASSPCKYVWIRFNDVRWFSSTVLFTSSYGLADYFGLKNAIRISNFLFFLWTTSVVKVQGDSVVPLYLWPDFKASGLNFFPLVIDNNGTRGTLKSLHKRPSPLRFFSWGKEEKKGAKKTSQLEFIVLN